MSLRSLLLCALFASVARAGSAVALAGSPVVLAGSPVVLAGSPVVLAAQEGQLGPGFEDDAIVARGKDIQIAWKDLDDLLLLRHSMTQPGREALRHLSETRMVEAIATEQSLTVSPDEVEARLKTLQDEWKKSGQTISFEQQIKNARLSEPEFRYFLRTGMLQEALTRRALGLKAGTEVNADQTRLWIQEAFTDRQYSELLPPWKDGVVARATNLTVTLTEYVRYLRRRLEPDELRQDCYQLMLYRRVRERMPDVAQTKIDTYVQSEIDRRRREAMNDPKNKGLPFEKLLAAQGLSIESLPRDPGLVVSALSKLWIDRAYDPETLKRSYQDERAFYDDLFGEALQVWMLFLRASQFKNELNPRTFAEAESELGTLARALKNVSDFQKAAKKGSEDASTRESGGELGWVSAGTRGVAPEVRAEVKKRLAQAPSSADAVGEGLFGPLRTSTGCVLLWLGPRRGAPTWEVMSGFVQRELRRRFLEEALPRTSVTYFLGNP